MFHKISPTLLATGHALDYRFCPSEIQIFTPSTMADLSFDEAVRRSIKLNPQYLPGGYDFVREALQVAVNKYRDGDEMRHVTGQELLDGFREYALKEYGPMAMTILDQWGIREGLDVGKIVYLLIEVGYFGKSDGDSLQDFDNGYTFEEAFLTPFLPRRATRASN